LVDDEPKVVDMVGNFLAKSGFDVLTAGDGPAALSRTRDEQPDLIVLDLMLPGLSGTEVCREVREFSDVPIIMLTARADEVDKILGLELGADDYITKPFSLRELEARIRVVLRRRGRTALPQNVVSFGSLRIDIDAHEVQNAGRVVELTPTEFAILTLLAGSPGRVFSRMQILDAAMGEAYAGYERSVDTHIRNLRRKIESDPSVPVLIQTVFGVGYKFSVS
jgi:two-component system OmpR family response regulator